MAAFCTQARDSRIESSRRRARRFALAGLATAAAAVVGPRVARAESMDFALERLVTDPSCRTTDGQARLDSSGNVITCQSDDAAFKKLVSQYGMAIAPSSMYPARTTGYGGFEIAVEGIYTAANASADYMRKGTRGAVDGNTGVASTENTAVPSVFQLYSLRIRKGFGYGFETGLSFGYLTSTSIISGGLDVRWSLLEGFRRGALGYLPEIAATGSVRSITGSPQMQLTVAGVSGVMSKPITIAQTGVLTPWVGYQYLWLFGDSSTIDFTPGTDALAECGYQGPNQPGFSDGSTPQDGGRLCQAGASGADANNSQIFAPARLERQRLLLGLNYRYEYFVVGGQAMIEVVSPASSQTDPADAQVLAGEAAQFGMALQVGAQF